MDDRELDEILGGLGQKRYVPSERLIKQTRSAIRGRRLFHIVAFLSLSLQILGVGVGVYILMSPEVEPVARVFTLAGLTAFFGAIAVVVVAARTQVVVFFRRVEQLTG
jgi:hypothetical protein